MIGVDRIGGPQLAAVAIASALVLLAPFFAPSYLLFELTFAGAYAIAILGLIVLTGYTGQISLGHGAFVAIGAYTLAICAQRAGIPAWASIPLAALICGTFGTLVGVVALRLSGTYLALATFALAVVVAPTLKRFGGLTGGAQGITLATVHAQRELFYLTWAILGALGGLACIVLSGRVGRGMRAIRDCEIAAISFGVNPTRYKALAFGWSAAYAGIAGALLALATAYVGPDSYTLNLSITLLIGAVLGGIERLWGAVVGGIVVEFLPLWAQAINPAASSLVYGIALVIVAIAVPGGIAGAFGFAIGSPARVARARALHRATLAADVRARAERI